MMIDPPLLRAIFDETMDLFFLHEVDAVLEGVNERNNCGRMAVYMQGIALRFGLNGYIADTEYNRKQNGQIKTIINDKYEVIPINCDLILHSRGRLAQDNLIAVEVKKYDTPAAGKDKDRDRLRALTKVPGDDRGSGEDGGIPEHVCDYTLGVLVEIDRVARVCRFEYYENGGLFQQGSRTF